MFQQSVPFGEELRRRRLAAGFTLTDLSRRVYYSKGQLSKVERGLKPPSRELARLCDTALDAGGELAALVRARPTKAQVTEVNDDDEEVWRMRLPGDGPSWFQPVSRRKVVLTGAVSMAGLGIGVSAPETSRAETGDATLLSMSRTLFDQYRRFGQVAGPDLLLPALIAQTHSLREQATRIGPRTQPKLLRLASRYAEYAGWLAQETGDDHAALWWTRHAIDLATAGGDHHLAAYGLVRHALISLYRDDAEQTIELAARAQAAAVPSRIRGLAAQREAQGHALAGDYAACMRCLDRARDLLDRDDTDPDTPVLGPTNLPDPVAMITGWCLYDLGRPRQAADLIDAQLARVRPQATRTRVRYGMRAALASAAAGEIDRACHVAGSLLDGVVAVRSATIAADMRALARTLARHPRNPSVRELLPRLGTALRASETTGEETV